MGRNYSEFPGQKRLENARKMQENIENLLKDVQMGPFGLILRQDGSQGLWEASGMPPGQKNA